MSLSSAIKPVFLSFASDCGWPKEYAAHEFETLARHVASLRVPGLLSALKL